MVLVKPEEESSRMSSSKKVCVIGAGPSGLVSARELSKEGHKVVVMEQNDDVGGQWLYQHNIEEEDPLGKSKTLKVHSSVYSSLRLASPREVMGFTDFPFLVKKGRDFRRFPGHEELWLYLKDFCHVFGLRDMIRFNVRVEFVGMVNDNDDNHDDHAGDNDGNDEDDHDANDANDDDLDDYGNDGHDDNDDDHDNDGNHDGDHDGNDDDSDDGNDDDDGDDDDHDGDGVMKRWIVKSVEKKSGEVIEEVFDAVVVASGHYSYPRLPNIKGMDLWKRKQIHSHVYRIPDSFRDEVVVVVGCSMSGQDISIEIGEIAKEVHISAKSLHNISIGFSKLISKHQNLFLHPQIESLEENGQVNFVDGSSIVADTILYCTGYCYKFPFLDTKGKIKVDENRVGPLFEHTFSPSLSPSLSFVGIPRKLIGFHLIECQAKWIAMLLSGKTSLPSYQQMMKSIEDFYHSRDIDGILKHNTHDIRSYEYFDKYADYIGFPHLEEWRKELAMSSLINSLENLETFRDSWDDDDLLQQALKDPYFTQNSLL